MSVSGHKLCFMVCEFVRNEDVSGFHCFCSCSWPSCCAFVISRLYISRNIFQVLNGCRHGIKASKFLSEFRVCFYVYLMLSPLGSLVAV